MGRALPLLGRRLGGHLGPTRSAWSPVSPTRQRWGILAERGNLSEKLLPDVFGVGRGDGLGQFVARQVRHQLALPHLFDLYLVFSVTLLAPRGLEDDPKSYWAASV